MCRAIRFAHRRRDGNFAADVTLEPGVNEISVTARDRVGNEVTETRRVAFFPYSTRWTVAGASGGGDLMVFLDVTDPAGAAVEVDSATAELVDEDGDVEVSEERRTATAATARTSAARPRAPTPCAGCSS
ncbi:MAG TPA: hypothetical protein VML35_04070 [Gaiellaceae bacterium]|nr:hypothetical protein [Gaiellaceae bacterium]